MKKFRIATRSSQLALWQANYMSDLIHSIASDIEVELVDVTTIGDQDQSQPLRTLGGTGVFTREVQQAVLDSRAEIAVHSLKDLPTVVVAPELTLACVPPRANRWDALVLPANSSLEIDPENPLSCLAPGSRIGSGSPRRQAQLKANRPDLKLLEIRGNLSTRLQKLDAGEYDAIILAAAGLQRLGWDERLSALLMPPLMYPAVGQGALGIECRADDERTRSLLAQLTDPETQLATVTERTVLAQLQAGCHAPVGISCSIDQQTISVQVIVLSQDGQQSLLEKATATLPIDSDFSSNQSQQIAINLGKNIANNLLAQGADALIAEQP
ncbi:MAG: hydroxymethylbilane synthase [Planctomycetaceae bacterium]|nr:hydroxymethylbilane synthase [Planctomycetaceae bacterium]